MTKPIGSSLFALLLLASACSAEKDGPRGNACTSSTECPRGMRCIDNVCATPTDGGALLDAGTSSGRDADSAGDASPDGSPTDAATAGDAPCVVLPVPAAFENPERELRWRGEGHPHPLLEQVIVSPVVIDLIDDTPDDKVPEIVFISYQVFDQPGVLRVISGRAPHATVMTIAGDGSLPDAPDGVPSLRFDAHPAAADLDGVVGPEIVAVLAAGGLIALRSDGSELWRLSLDISEVTPNGSVSIADLDHDGIPEVVVGRVVVNGRTGALRWRGEHTHGYNSQGPLSCVADVDGMGSMEIVAGGTVYDSEGDVFWQVEGDGFCAVADIVDATGASARDGHPEVVRVRAGELYLHDGATGAVRFTRSLPDCNGASGAGGAPTVADFDGDGMAEIGVAGAWCYTVFDPGCVGTTLPAGCHADGILWQANVEDDSSNVTSSTVFDFNGDGRSEVVYNDEKHFLVLDGLDGHTVFSDFSPSRTRTEQPIVADCDNDGNAEIIFGSNTEAAFAGEGIPAEERVPGLEIWSSADDAWVGARTIWNQHTYHVDNITSSATIPLNEAASWGGHNTYRANLSFESAFAAPDLTAALERFDELLCGEEILRVCARIINRGGVRVGPGVRVAFYDGDPSTGGALIGHTNTTARVEPGGGEVVCVDWTPAPVAPRTVYVNVDTEGAARECVETNNIVLLGDGYCPPFG